MRTFIVRIAVILTLLATVFGVVADKPQRAVAYHGENVDTWNWSQTSPDSGCFFSLHIYVGRRARMYCGMRNRQNGDVIYKTDYMSYQCGDGGNCDPEGYISGWGDDWEAISISLINDDDTEGAAGHIRFCGPL